MWYASQLSFLLSLVLDSVQNHCSRHNKSNHGIGRDNSDIIPLGPKRGLSCRSVSRVDLQAVEGPSPDTDFDPPPPHGAPSPPPAWTNLWSGASQDLPSYMRHILPNPLDRSVSTQAARHGPGGYCVLYVRHMDDGELYCRACFRYQGTGPAFDMEARRHETTSRPPG